MRKIIFALCLFWAACSKEAPSRVKDYVLIHPEYSLGEYLQIENSENVVTVNRAGSQTGLVRVHLPTEEVSVLDSTAMEAKEIRLSNDKIVWRTGTELKFYTASKTLTLRSQVKKLFTFCWFGNEGRLSFETTQKETFWMLFNAEGSMLKESPLPGSASANLCEGPQELIALKMKDGLYLMTFTAGQEPQGVLIEKGNVGAYAAFKRHNNQLYLAYMDETLGILKLAHRKEGEKEFTIETIDGTPDETYRGMDIALFEDEAHVGLIYLDGLRLKLRMARWKNNHWETEELPIPGAVGFYTQVLQKEGDHLSIVFNNFRSDSPEKNSTFDDLAKATLYLP